MIFCGQFCFLFGDHRCAGIGAFASSNAEVKIIAVLRHQQLRRRHLGEAESDAKPLHPIQELETHLELPKVLLDRFR